MRGLGLDLYSGLTSIDSTYYGFGPGEPTTDWFGKLIQIGADIYQDIAGPQNPYYYPPYSQTYPYQTLPTGTNWLPWILIGGAILLVATSKKK